jgi:ribosomal protein S18 acetylase RimI-like enzyme
MLLRERVSKEAREDVRDAEALAFERVSGKIVGAVGVHKSAWDTETLGFAAGRFTPVVFEPSVDYSRRAETFAKALSEARNLGIRMVVCRVPASDLQTLYGIQLAGGRHVDTLVTFRNDGIVTSRHGGILVRPDGNLCTEISDSFDGAFEGDRFHADPLIGEERARGLTRRWIQTAADDPSKYMLVSRQRGKLIGFVLIKVVRCTASYSYCVIELIAVKQGLRGHGVAHEMLHGLLRTLTPTRPFILVGTQAANMAAIRLYAKAGFIPVSIDSTYHFWT